MNETMASVCICAHLAQSSLFSVKQEQLVSHKYRQHTPFLISLVLSSNISFSSFLPKPACKTGMLSKGVSAAEKAQCLLLCVCCCHDLNYSLQSKTSDFKLLFFSLPFLFTSCLPAKLKKLPPGYAGFDELGVSFSSPKKNCLWTVPGSLYSCVCVMRCMEVETLSTAIPSSSNTQTHRYNQKSDTDGDGIHFTHLCTLHTVMSLSSMSAQTSLAANQSISFLPALGHCLVSAKSKAMKAWAVDNAVSTERHLLATVWSLQSP